MPDFFVFLAPGSVLCLIYFIKKRLKNRTECPSFFDSVPIVAHILGAVFDPQNLHFGCLGTILAPLGSILAPLGSILAPLGSILVAVGSPGFPKVTFLHFWGALLPPLGSHLAPLWSTLGAQGSHFGAFLVSFGTI